MTDTNKLKELAEAANRARRQWYTEDDCCWWTGNVDEGDFLAAANPQAILGLISRLDGLLEQHGRDSAELRALCQARDDARKERDRLKAENEALRVRLKALIHISDATGWEIHTCGEIAKARAAMEGGER